MHSSRPGGSILGSATVLIVLCGILCLLPGETGPDTGHACRFWGLVGSDYPSDLIADHLMNGTVTNLRILGGMNRDGWGFASFLDDSSELRLSGALIRRGRPRADHSSDPDYGIAVAEMNRLRPKAAIGHVRSGTSGHWGIPDPHPFQHEGFVFAHNGSVATDALIDSLTKDDPGYLEKHPPDYVHGYVDSELYMLYLLKEIAEHPEMSRTEALLGAVWKVAAGVDASKLNFVATSGDTLFALRHAILDSHDPVRYYPDVSPPRSSPYWVVASEVMGSDADDWGTIPSQSLAVFVPGDPPKFYPIEPPVDPSASLVVGLARPNPAHDRFTIPVRAMSPTASVVIEIWDVQGRLVWSDGPTQLDGSETMIEWDSRNLRGEQVPTGSYFCKVSNGTVHREQTITVVR